MLQIANGLAERGHSVAFFVPSASPESQARAKGFNVELFCLPSSLQNVRLRWKTPLALWKMLVLSRKRRVTSLYVFYEPFGILVAYVIGRAFQSIRVTIAIVGMSWQRVVLRSLRQRIVYRAALNRCNCLNFYHSELVPISEPFFTELGVDIDGKDLLIADIGVQLGEIFNTAQPARAIGPMIAVIPTRFSSTQKRQDLIIQALAALPANVHIEARFVGDGTREGELAQLASTLLQPDSFHFLGFLPHKMLWEEMRRADVVLLATEYEGFSKVVAEAMAIGIPVLVSKVPTLDSYIIHEKNGFLVPNNVNAWSTMLEALYRDPHLRQSVILAGQQFVNKYASPKSNVLVFEKYLVPQTGRNYIQ